MRKTPRPIFAALLVLLVLPRLIGCGESQSTSNRQSSMLTNLHNKIVYIEAQSSGGQRFTLFYFDPIERKATKILKTKNLIQTLYLPGRDKIVTHEVRAGNTRTGDIYFADIDGSNPKRIVRGSGFSPFPDKKRFAFSSDLGKSGTYYVFSADFSGKHIKQLTFKPNDVKRKVGPGYLYVGDAGPQVSPKGKYLLFGSNWYNQDGSEPHDVFIAQTDGSSRKRLTNAKKTGFQYGLGAFSHDGKKFQLTATKRGKRVLFVMGLDGQILKKYQIGQNSVYDWSPDDKEILLANNYSISILNLRSGKLTKIVQLDKNDRKTIGTVSWLD